MRRARVKKHRKQPKTAFDDQGRVPKEIFGSMRFTIMAAAKCPANIFAVNGRELT
jgi:hypothetical protein